MALEFREWNKLPYHILVDVFSYLRLGDKNRASRACRIFQDVFNDGMTWKGFSFYFYTPVQKKYLEGIKKYGKYFKWIYIELDQGVPNNRENACSVMRQIYDLPQRQLKSLTLKFVGETPYFYEGNDFVNTMHLLFGPPQKGCVLRSHIVHIDLSNLPIKIDDKLMRTISENCNQLLSLDIVNRSLTSYVTPAGLLSIAEGCNQLSELRISHTSLDNEVLLGLISKKQKSLKLLDVTCRRNDSAACKDIPNATWKMVVKVLPNLKVIFRFEHTFPPIDMREIMQPDVPVKTIVIETYTYIYEEVDTIRKYYFHTLEEFKLITPSARNAPELNRIFICLASECKKLRSMHVNCLLYKETVDKILQFRPEIKENYTLLHS